MTESLFSSLATNNNPEYPPQRVYWREPTALAGAPMQSYIPEPRNANVPRYHQPEPTSADVPPYHQPEQRSADVPPYNQPEPRQNYYPSFQRNRDNSGNSQRRYNQHSFGTF
ncbi:hypothetical protein EB796_007221 [Bugula neritina]|uniref:Uncharacterized protein n=1 Tax=Bugula neritina TaxID=10212 RepID=A0A7J7K763_BUGNE|nr:hypothetical protein EB796_007221 [Bugula neritina]